MTGKKGSTQYAQAIRLEAVRLFYEEGMTRRAIADKLGLRNERRVKEWAKIYRRKGVDGFSQVKRGRPPKKENTKAYVARLEMENALLKKFHTELRNEALAKRNIGLSTITAKNTK